MSINSIIGSILVISFIVGMTLQYFLLRILRAKHPSTWEALGRPTLIANNSPANSIAVLRFIWRKDYSELDDAEFTRLADAVRLFMVLYFIFFGCVLLASLYAIFSPAFARTI
jgi:hypothetical protein